METPGAGPSRLQAPVTPKSRRRSWFHFGSSSTTPPPPLPTSDVQEELELSPLTPRQSKDGGRAVIEEEDLDIDGQLVKTTTKKKKKKSKGGTKDEEGEVVRMMDLKPPLPSRKGSASGSDTSSRTELGIGTAYTKRTFSRTASDRTSHTAELVQPPPRKSSIQQPVFNRTPSVSSNTDKEQPLLPSDRPLPPLPPPQRSSTPPTAPTGIYVTPSSPIRPTHNTTSIGSQADRIHPSNQVERRDSSESYTAEEIKNLRSSPIGLGLPRQLTPDNQLPPPVPSKKQSVSSPLPSAPSTRSSSPAPKISFVEPDQEGEERGREMPQERRQKVRRARSLSGIFKTANITTEQRLQGGGIATTLDPKEKEKEKDEKGGVLEWLGVKKTVKRRQSETHLRQPPGPPSEQHIPRIPSPAPRVSNDSRKGAPGSYSDLTGLRRESRDSQRPSRPSSRNALPNPVPNPKSIQMSTTGSSSKLGSLFSRRASKHPDGQSPSPPASLPSATLSPRDASARSSFSLPPFDAGVSPIYPTSGPWMSSPSTETEEMLFSPEGANWGQGMRPWMDETERQRQQPQRSARSSFSSPPPAPVIESSTAEPAKGQGGGQDGRARSHSDAPQPSAVTIQANHLRPDSPSLGSRLASSLSSSPSGGGRPKMGNRANSGNAAIIDRMKTVFARSSSRQRASTLLPDAHTNGQGHGFIDEFGSMRSSSEWPSPSNVSSISSSPRTTQDRLSSDDPTGLGLQDDRLRVGCNQSSVASSSSRPEQTRSLVSRARPRASTVSVGPTTQAFIPASPVMYPAAATPPRRRPSAIRKLSNTLLGGTARVSSSPKSSSLFPLPPRSSGSVSSGLTASGFHWDETSSVGTSMSPRPSFGSIAPPTPNIKQLSARHVEESPENYVRRISSTIPRNEIAGVLATSSDPFYAESMRLYMTKFDFTHQPLDIALRQLLMHMSLPKETQQIDRVVEAFAVRYEQCEPGLFKDKDNTYVVAFSMMMLHTDAFNKHNKNKMSKADYVRNTRMDGVSPLVLEAFYDNITFTPFVFIEDDADLRPIPHSTGAETQSALSTPGSMGPPRSGKVDVYHMIVNQLLHTLRLHVDRQIPLESPFSTLGMGDIEHLHQTFAKATILSVTLPGKRKTSTGILSSTPTRGAPAQEVMLRITKVGTLSRTDDHESTKKGNRKWKSWSVVLTNSQLLFVKDSIMAITLSERIKQVQAGTRPNSTLLPPMPNFKPDEVISLKDCIAIYDRSYTRAQATFRLVMPGSRQYLLQASDEEEMNTWIGLVNYASTFKSAGIRMRGMSMKKEQVVLAGAAAAASHKRDVNDWNVDITPKKSFFGDSSESPVRSSQEGTLDVAGGVEVDDLSNVVNEGEQLEEVFDVVKAELAAGRGPGQKRPTSSSREPTPSNGTTTNQAQASRAASFETQIDSLITKRDELLSLLSASLITARNLAIITPFQKPTREKLSQSITPLATTIRTHRVQLAKVDHYLSILKRELELESQEWATVRHVALQAAAKSLSHPEGVKSVVDDVNVDVNGSGKRDLPKLALPDSDDTDSLSPLTPSPMMGTSPGEWPITMLRAESSDHDRRDGERAGVDDGGRTREEERERRVNNRPIRQSSTASSTTQSRPRLQRSTSSQLSIRSDGGDAQLDTGRSTPVMFNLSESEAEQEEVNPQARYDGRNGNREVERGGTVRAKRTQYPALAREASTPRSTSVKGTENGDGKESNVSGPDGSLEPRKKREREVTAVYIGPQL